ncbi:IPT/TIG domain-containing protein [Kitasatospora sp. NPDC058406]|uniref:IPT/TIG domain-containing protein n=1 Tax=Streptomycetaceae TaxID=2062 RepID=UPI002E782BD1|nr:IPT/TIG domain-containing protein [Streptomyces sp. BE303]MED7950066.1 IPT/TIG domain-containing protein [Streptomyces sp. BE303]
MITRLVRGGLAAALAVAALTTGAAVSTAATTTGTAAKAAVTGQNVTVTQAGNYPIFPVDHTNISVTWKSTGTADLTGVTHLTVELPPGLTTDGATITSFQDYTFTQTVSPDGRRLDAYFTGNRAPGRSEFMKVTVASHGTRPSGTIKVTAANRNDADPSDNVSSYLLGSGPQAPATQAAPVVAALGTTTGPGTGGTPVTLTGTGLDNGFVLFGDSVAAGSCTATGCAVTAPGGSGSVPVTVVTPGGSATAATTFDYTGAAPPAPAAPAVTGLTTSTGPAAGGTQIYVQGAGLANGTVRFGGVPATRYSCGPALCSATAPAGSGVVDVTVTTAGGTSAPVTAGRFTYTP